MSLLGRILLQAMEKRKASMFMSVTKFRSSCSTILVRKGRTLKALNSTMAIQSKERKKERKIRHLVAMVKVHCYIPVATIFNFAWNKRGMFQSFSSVQKWTCYWQLLQLTTYRSTQWPGMWAYVSQMLGPLPPSFTAPSYCNRMKIQKMQKAPKILLCFFVFFYSEHGHQ